MRVEFLAQVYLEDVALREFTSLDGLLTPCWLVRERSVPTLRDRGQMDVQIMDDVTPERTSRFWFHLGDMRSKVMVTM
ncbi:hypothetical protein ACWCOW_09205 [Streptomyces sp. NPDC001939]